MSDIEKINITWLGQGGFLFSFEGYRMIIDPYMSNSLKEIQNLQRLVEFPLSLEELKVDSVICTHDHIDHFDEETIVPISNAYPDCKFYGSLNAFNHFEKLAIKANLLEIGMNVKIGPFNICPVVANHSDKASIGIVISASNQKIYLTSDTLYNQNLISNMTKDCDLLLVCINGKLGNMDINDAIKLSKDLNAKSSSPMHYGLFAENTADPKEFLISVKNPKELFLGKTVSI